MVELKLPFLNDSKIKFHFPQLSFPFVVVLICICFLIVTLYQWFMDRKLKFYSCPIDEYRGLMISAGYHCIQGRRPTMEDAHSIILELLTNDEHKKTSRREKFKRLSRNGNHETLKKKKSTKKSDLALLPDLNSNKNIKINVNLIDSKTPSSESSAASNSDSLSNIKHVNQTFPNSCINCDIISQKQTNNGLKASIKSFLSHPNFMLKKREKLFDDKMLDSKMSFFAIYDGHSGIAAAQYAQKKIHTKLAKDKRLFLKGTTHTDICQSLVSSFTKTDKEYYNSMHLGISSAGTTACTALIRNGFLYVANAGDSRAVFSRGGELIEMSEDHKPNILTERSRIEKIGGEVHAAQYMANRCTFSIGPQRVWPGGLSVSRGLGDWLLKDPTELQRLHVTGPIISSYPEIKYVRLACMDNASFSHEKKSLLSHNSESKNIKEFLNLDGKISLSEKKTTPSDNSYSLSDIIDEDNKSPTVDKEKLKTDELESLSVPLIKKRKKRYIKEEKKKIKCAKFADFLVIGCDGLWDKITNEEIVKFINSARPLEQVKAMCDILENRNLPIEEYAEIKKNVSSSQSTINSPQTGPDDNKVSVSEKSMNDNNFFGSDEDELTTKKLKIKKITDSKEFLTNTIKTTFSTKIKKAQTVLKTLYSNITKKMAAMSPVLGITNSFVSPNLNTKNSTQNNETKSNKIIEEKIPITLNKDIINKINFKDQKVISKKLKEKRKNLNETNIEKKNTNNDKTSIDKSFLVTPDNYIDDYKSDDENDKTLSPSIGLSFRYHRKTVFTREMLLHSDRLAAMRLAERLTTIAYERNSQDNISVIIILFRWDGITPNTIYGWEQLMNSIKSEKTTPSISSNSNTGIHIKHNGLNIIHNQYSEINNTETINNNISLSGNLSCGRVLKFEEGKNIYNHNDPSNTINETIKTIASMHNLIGHDNISSMSIVNSTNDNSSISSSTNDYIASKNGMITTEDNLREYEINIDRLDVDDELCYDYAIYSEYVDDPTELIEPSSSSADDLETSISIDEPKIISPKEKKKNQKVQIRDSKKNQLINPKDKTKRLSNNNKNDVRQSLSTPSQSSSTNKNIISTLVSSSILGKKFQSMPPIKRKVHRRFRIAKLDPQVITTWISPLDPSYDYYDITQFAKSSQYMHYRKNINEKNQLKTIPMKKKENKEPSK